MENAMTGTKCFDDVNKNFTFLNDAKFPFHILSSIDK